MHDEAVAPAWEAINKAMSLRDKSSAKERALIEALASRYGATPTPDRSALDRAWAARMKEVAARFPDDANILTLYADALMNLQPWDYWESDGVTPKKNAADIVAALEKALALEPGHPGAAHLYIHAFEASATPERAEAAADRLRGVAPAVGHLVHMPSHIYARIGRHKDSMDVNRDAIAADERTLAAAGDAARAIYRYGYYPHNVHFMMASAQMAGVKDSALAAARKLDEITSADFSQQLAWVQAIKTAIYAAHAQFVDVDAILAMKGPDDRLPFVKGFWHYARGVAHAARGDLPAAQNEVRAIEDLIAHADMSNLEAQLLPARNVLTLAKHVIDGRIAQARANHAAAEDHFRKAAELEAAIPYMEPPYWYYPVRQSLGAALLRQGRAKAAAVEFKAALQARPRSGWALWGLMQAQIATGDPELKGTRAAFKKAWLGENSLLSLDRL